MRVRSTGLGTTMMVARIGSIKRLEGSLLMVMESSEPVKWKIRIALTYKDILMILKIWHLEYPGFLGC